MKVPQIDGLRIEHLVDFLKTHGFEAYLPTLSKSKVLPTLQRDWLANVSKKYQYSACLNFVGESYLS